MCIILIDKAFLGFDVQWVEVISMEIKRNNYLEQLISYRFDGLVKVITGIRRCGNNVKLRIM